MLVVQSHQVTMIITRTPGDTPGDNEKKALATFLQSALSFIMLQPTTFGQGSRSCKRTTNLANSFWVIVKYEQSINLSLLPRCLIRQEE